MTAERTTRYTCGVRNAIGNQLPHCAIDKLHHISLDLPIFTWFGSSKTQFMCQSLMAVEVVSLERAQSKRTEQYPAQRNPSGVDQASN